MNYRKIKQCLLFLLLMGIIEPLAARTAPLPLPRFVSLRGKTVNLHVGPGNNYPTEWTFVRPGLPVEIIAEFDTWRQIRDCQGTQGWVHQSLLCGKRTAIVQQKQRKLYKEPEETSRVVAHLEPGVLGKLVECRNDWCRLDVEGHRGWIKRRCIWGVYPHEEKFK
jgi:SH3-like domain-containing protein